MIRLQLIGFCKFQISAAFLEPKRGKPKTKKEEVQLDDLYLYFFTVAFSWWFGTCKTGRTLVNHGFTIHEQTKSADEEFFQSDFLNYSHSYILLSM